MQYINYRESRQRGTADFPIEYHHVSPTHPQYIMALHWHVEFELIRILSGSLKLTVDEEEYTAKAGSSCFIPAGTIHAGEPDNCVYECLVFDMNVLMNKNDDCCRMIRRVIDHQVELPHHFPESCTEINRIVWSIFDASTSKNEGYQLVVLGAMYQLFGTIFATHDYRPVPEKQTRTHRRILQLKQALEFMESSYNQPITLEEMAESVGMSPKYFCRFFHEMTHRTPVDYLNYYRIERACYQLMTTNLSITDVAYGSGFNDLSYFIKTFKKYKGTTPKKFLR